MTPAPTIDRPAGPTQGRKAPGAPVRHRQRAARILNALTQAGASSRMELDCRSPFELLVATILSAQCTDQRVNQVTPVLFRRYRTPDDFADAGRSELEGIIRSTGFFKAKARSLIACGRALAERHAGKVPRTMEALTALPGVGRKTANVVLGNAFGEPAVVVDTHVKRVAQRLGLARRSDPDHIEIELQRLIPPAQWTSGSQRLLLHGRYICTSRKPVCARCIVYVDCPWEGKARR